MSILTDVTLITNGENLNATVLNRPVNQLGAAINNRSITAGNGLTGGGDLSANRTLVLGTPGSLSGSTTNNVTATSHTHAINTPSEAQAVSGTDNSTLMTPLRTHQALTSRSITAGNGLTGGGDLSTSRTLVLGTPGTLNAGGSNSVTANSHTHAITAASEAQALAGSDSTGVMTAQRTHQAFNRFGLGTSSTVNSGTLSALNHNCFFAHASAGGDGEWDSANGTYPMGIHFERSGSVQSQFAIGYNGHPAYRTKTASTTWGPWRRIYHTGNLNPVEVSRTITAGNGLTGGGDLSTNRTITLGTPGTLSGASINSASASSHTHALAIASETQAELATGGGVLMTPHLTHRAFGAYGLGNSGVLVSSVNSTGGVNDDNRFFRNDGAGRPGGSSRGGGIQFGWGNSERSQIFADPNNERVWVRHRYSSTANTWKPWTELYHSGNLSVSDIGGVPESRTITAGNGLTGGGNLSANRTITLGTPGTLTPSTTNSVTSTSHTHNIATPTQNEVLTTFPSVQTTTFMTPSATETMLSKYGAGLIRTVSSWNLNSELDSVIGSSSTINYKFYAESVSGAPYLLNNVGWLVEYVQTPNWFRQIITSKQYGSFEREVNNGAFFTRWKVHGDHVFWNTTNNIVFNMNEFLIPGKYVINETNLANTPVNFGSSSVPMVLEVYRNLSMDANHGIRSRTLQKVSYFGGNWQTFYNGGEFRRHETVTSTGGGYTWSSWTGQSY